MPKTVSAIGVDPVGNSWVRCGMPIEKEFLVMVETVNPLAYFVAHRSWLRYDEREVWFPAEGEDPDKCCQEREQPDEDSWNLYKVAVIYTQTGRIDHYIFPYRILALILILLDVTDSYSEAVKIANRMIKLKKKDGATDTDKERCDRAEQYAAEQAKKATISKTVTGEFVCICQLFQSR